MVAGGLLTGACPGANANLTGPERCCFSVLNAIPAKRGRKGVSMWLMFFLRSGRESCFSVLNAIPTKRGRRGVSV